MPDGRYRKPCKQCVAHVAIGDGRLAGRTREVGLHSALIEATKREIATAPSAASSRAGAAAAASPLEAARQAGQSVLAPMLPRNAVPRVVPGGAARAERWPGRQAARGVDGGADDDAGGDSAREGRAASSAGGAQHQENGEETKENLRP